MTEREGRQTAPALQVVDRKQAPCFKYDFAHYQKAPDLIPMWLADMDFATAPAVLAALQQRVAHGAFGYAPRGEAYDGAVLAWLREHQHWSPEAEWMIVTPGVNAALRCCVRTLTAPGESVLLLAPVYGPFYDAIRQNGRRVVELPLRYAAGRYSLDAEQMEALVAREKVKLFLLCNPHNPIGRVWLADELAAMGEICLRHGVTIVSDEIHSDFIFPGHHHTSIASLSEDLCEASVVCTAPTKTFNLAGLPLANIFVCNAGRRARIRQELLAAGMTSGNALSYTACTAAYLHGAAWQAECLAYIVENRRYLEARLRECVPDIVLPPQEGTYLAWLDFSAFPYRGQALDAFLEERAGLWLSPGWEYGTGGEAFQRMNLACSRETVARACDGLQRAFAG